MTPDQLAQLAQELFDEFPRLTLFQIETNGWMRAWFATGIAGLDHVALEQDFRDVDPALLYTDAADLPNIPDSVMREALEAFRSKLLNDDVSLELGFPYVWRRPSVSND